MGSFAIVLVLLNLSPVAATDAIELDGLIEPYLIVKVGSPVPGILKTIEVDRESEVEKATMALARARAGMESTLSAREERLKFSQRKQQRMEELYRKKVIPFGEMDESRTNSALAMMELAEAKENKHLAELELKRSIEVVKRMTIYSPITGVVVERFLSAGEHVEDQPILQLAQIDPLNVEVFAPVELLGTIKVGMPANVTPEKPMDTVYKARVKIVDRVVDAASGTFGVRLQLPNSKYGIPAGLKCKVRFLKK
jgi:RND family efflux transporter MFP subunit